MKNNEKNDGIFPGLSSGIDLELDFDLSDFSLTDSDTPIALTDGEAQQHILKPRMNVGSVSHMVAYENAQAFVRQLDMEPGARTFAYVSGSFIFGDMIEALWEHRGVDVKSLYVASLSMSAENIDSLRNVLLYSNVERLSLVLSGYFYSHEKYGLVQYLYERLDDPRVQIAFGAYHAKLFTMESHRGNVFTCHGSANLRSSNSIEQIEFEAGNKALHDWNAEIIDHICDLYGTINHGSPEARRMTDKESWRPFKRSD